MKTFETIDFDPHQCRPELEAFRTLLSTHDELSERLELLRFFRERKHLTALLGTFHPGISKMDRIAHEYDLFGDFKCDFVVGDFERNAYCFIEFENAKEDSVFSYRERSTSKWGSRFDKGFSQIVDWAYKLADTEKTDAFQDRFGSQTVDSMSILVIGRSCFVTSPELKRLEWRRKFVTVNSQQIRCMTYDQLLKEFDYSMRVYPAAAEAEAATRTIPAHASVNTRFNLRAP